MKKQRLSLSVQLMLAMSFIVLITVGLCWILNNTFLEKYYYYNKQKELLSSYQIISKASEEGELESEEFDVTFEKLCATGNMDIIVIGSEWSIIRSSSTNMQKFQSQLFEILRGATGNDRISVIKETDDYVLAKRIDSRMDGEYLVLWGNFADGSYIYMKTALESLRDSAEISNYFFKWIGGLCLIVSVAMIIFLSRRLSRPIRELTDLSKRMANLDFEAEYVEKQHGITEIEELGKHMNELSMALEQTISELKVANNELKQDIQKKEQIDEIRKEFLSNVSHELKTPLALIQGYSEGLKECINEDEESRNFYCDVIVDETDKMNQMVKKLLTLNQLEFGNDVVEMVRFDITELIQGVIHASSLLASQEQIAVHFYQDGPMYVWGDEFKVEEVITNYISNALHHAAGEKRIEVFYTVKENLLRVSVFNTGLPIPEEDLEKVWIKFYKVDKARTREYGGSGIGLSIVKAIMDSFHQKCGVKNHANGVEFWMELESANSIL